MENDRIKKKKKIWPRVLAIIIAIAAVAVLFLINRYGIYKPAKNEDPKFSVETDENGKTNVKLLNDKSYNFLIMGHDRAANLTDVNMLINYNLKEQKVTIMQIPRDTYINIEDYYYHKINGLYGYFYQNAIDNGTDNPEQAAVLNAAEYIEKYLSVKIHFAAVMDLDGFEGIVDAIGGIDMNVPQDMFYSDASQNLYINLQAGYQHLDGAKAEQFVRYRSGYVTGDIGRGDAQKHFISAFISKLTSSIKDPGTINSLADNVIKYVNSDITDADIVYFMKAFLGFSETKKAIELSDVTLFTMPGYNTMYNGASVYVMNREYMIELIGEYYNIYDIDVNKSFDPNSIFSTPDNINSEVAQIYLDDKENALFTLYKGDEFDDN